MIKIYVFFLRKKFIQFAFPGKGMKEIGRERKRYRIYSRLKASKSQVQSHKVRERETAAWLQLAGLRSKTGTRSFSTLLSRNRVEASAFLLSATNGNNRLP